MSKKDVNNNAVTPAVPPTPANPLPFEVVELDDVALDAVVGGGARFEEMPEDCNVNCKC